MAYDDPLYPEGHIFKTELLPGAKYDTVLFYFLWIILLQQTSVQNISLVSHSWPSGRLVFDSESTHTEV